MKNLLKKVAKTAVLWFAAGALFALGANAAAPLLSGEIATLAQTSHAGWLGMLLAGTGVIANLVEPMLNACFGNAEKSVATVAKESEKQAAKQVNITVVQQPAKAQECCAHKHRDTVKTKRLILLTGQDLHQL